MFCNFQTAEKRHIYGKYNYWTWYMSNQITDPRICSVKSMLHELIGKLMALSNS